ncbi:MAG: serine/threonine-protein kinase [Sandaracinaceae bacterium]
MPIRRDALPRRFGEYRLFDQIGRGGMADIFLASVETDLGVTRRVVVKEILAELSADERFGQLFIEEAKLVCQLRHANVVQVFDLGREGDRLFIAMEYVEGYDLNLLLRRLTERRLGLPVQFVVFLLREILTALDYAHRAKTEDGRPMGIVHRDVSPSNVLISFEGEVKLCDFGIAKAFGASSVGTAARGSDDESTGERSKVAGKAAYMSPEQARGDEIDARSDLFAAGIILWELCAGRRLYRGDEQRMLEMAREGAIPPLPERGIPNARALQAFLDEALAFEPDQRFENAEAMLRALDDWAVEAKLFVSQIRFGAYLSEHFETEVVEVRRQRERAAEALALGPPVEIEPIAPTPAPAPPVAEARAVAPPRPKAGLLIAALAAVLLLAAIAALVLLR